MRQFIDLFRHNLFEAPVDIMQNAAFRKWFGGSKAVDGHGKPLVVYHGTTAHFDHFSGDDAPDRGGLIAFFSSSPQFASDYAAPSDVKNEYLNGNRVIPCYLRTLKPFDFRTNSIEAECFYEATGGICDDTEINRILMGLGRHDIDIFATGNTLSEEQFVAAVKAGSWDALEAPEFVEYLRGDGYDSVVLLENGAINYGIFEPEQVKSVFSPDFNSGDHRF